MQAFVDRYGLGGMITLVDDDGSLWRRYGVLYQPAWVFIGTDGDIEVVAGALHGDDLNDRLDRLAATASAAATSAP